MLTDQLHAYLFDGSSQLLSQPMASWLASSRQFTAFVSTYRDKIRKKLRATRDQESLLDLRLELETAYLLLQERSLSLVYEPQLAGRVRGPDFAVTHTTNLTFMLEVTRLHTSPKNSLAGVQEETSTVPALEIAVPISPMAERLADSVCSKLGQLLPQQSNVLLVSIETSQPLPSDLHAAMLRIQQRAERNDLAFLRRYRFRDRANFFHHYQRLSEILVRNPGAQGTGTAIGWVNPQAKYPLPPKVRTVLYRSHGIQS